jgi:acyl-CoA hydrolase
MSTIIRLNEIGPVIAERFKDKKYITCYVASNAVTPTASLQALTDYIKAGAQMPFMRMVSLLLLGEVPYVEPGLQDKIMAYSIFSGPTMRKAINEGRAYYLPCTLANMESMIGKDRPFQPDVVITRVTKDLRSGTYNLGPSLEAMYTAIDNAKVVIAEMDDKMPFVLGGNLDQSSIDYLVVDDDIRGIHPYVTGLEDLSRRAKQGIRRAGELIVKYFIKDGITLQIGIGKITDAIASLIKDARPKDLGCQTELYGDGLMSLQKAGIITNRHKKMNRWYSTTSLLMGSKELYEFANMRPDLQLRPCTYTNAAHIIRANGSEKFPFISINTAVGVDLGGNVWADYIDATRYYGGVGGQPDFVRALNDPRYGVAIIVMLSTTTSGITKIVKTHPAGVTLTACSYDNIVVVTEHGIADLRGLSAGCKARALAHIADESVRDELLRYIDENKRLFIAPRHSRELSGFIPYGGPTRLDG